MKLVQTLQHSLNYSFSESSQIPTVSGAVLEAKDKVINKNASFVNHIRNE